MSASPYNNIIIVIFFFNPVIRIRYFRCALNKLKGDAPPCNYCNLKNIVKDEPLIFCLKSFDLDDEKPL